MLRITRKNTKNKHKYFCQNCKDTNWLIECADGCGKVISRYGKNYAIKKFYKNHTNLGKNHHNYGKLKRENNPRWKGGKWQDDDGYWHIKKPDHPFCDSKGYVVRHRLVYEEYYNCILLPWVDIHHIIPIKEGGTDDIENLLPITRNNHISIHMKGNENALVDISDRRCSDPECPHPNKTYMRKLKNGKLRPSWRGNKKVGFKCYTCYKRRKNINKTNY